MKFIIGCTLIVYSLASHAALAQFPFAVESNAEHHDYQRRR